MDAADEIGLAVLATTMAIVAVFLPVGLMPGVSGQFFKSFGLTVVVSVMLSLFVARLITPMMAAYFLKSQGEQEHASGKWMDRYLAILHWTLANRWKTVAAGGFSFFLTIILFVGIPQIGIKALPFQALPDADFDYSTVKIEMVPGTTLERTKLVAESVQKMFATKRDMVETAFADIDPASARIFMSLKRDRPQSSLDFEREWTPRLAEVPDARVFFEA